MYKIHDNDSESSPSRNFLHPIPYNKSSIGCFLMKFMQIISGKSSSKFMQFSQKIRSYFVKPSVSVLVPAYNAQEFICETLDSLNNQIFKDFQILISIDRSDDNTKSIIKKWCKDHKNITTQIFYQTHRLGWVKNINFLLEKCKTKYFMVLPHDDMVHETYIQKMFQYLEANPSTCVVFSDIHGFGTRLLYITQNSIRGDRVERTLDFLIHHLSAVALRGLVNRAVLSDFILLHENNYSNIAMDSVWNMQMAIMGEVIRIPEGLYYKRYHDNSIHGIWWTHGEEDVKAWLEHCTDCLKVIFMAGFEQTELTRLIEATKSRLVQDVCTICPSKELSTLDEKERALLLEEFDKTVVALGKANNKSISTKSQMKNI